MSSDRLAQHLRSQAEACARLASPFHADLLTRAADDLAGRGVVADVLAGYEESPGPAAVGLRLLGTVHRLPLRVVERGGCDLDPLDPATEHGRLILTAYVWPDDTARLARLRGALRVARDVPAPVETLSAPDFLDGVRPREGSVLVVWHSVFWQYLSREEGTAVERRLQALGEAADGRAPVAHLSFEARRGDDGTWRFMVWLQVWPGGERRVLGEAQPHGVPVTWS